LQPDVRSHAAKGHLRRIHGAGAVSGLPPIATYRRAATRTARGLCDRVIIRSGSWCVDVETAIS
jgi:hypothetical protein